MGLWREVWKINKFDEVTSKALSLELIIIRYCIIHYVTPPFICGFTNCSELHWCCSCRQQAGTQRISATSLLLVPRVFLKHRVKERGLTSLLLGPRAASAIPWLLTLFAASWQLLWSLSACVGSWGEVCFSTSDHRHHAQGPKIWSQPPLFH